MRNNFEYLLTTESAAADARCYKNLKQPHCKRLNMLKIIVIYHYNTHAWLRFTMCVVKFQHIAVSMPMAEVGEMRCNC